MAPDKSDKNGHFTTVAGLSEWLTLSSQALLEESGRDSTNNAKRRFLVIFERAAGFFTVTQMCRYTGISRDTYYRWMEQDSSFKSAVEFIERYRNMIAEDMLWQKVVEGDGACVRYYLSHNHPSYMPQGRKCRCTRIAG